MTLDISLLVNRTGVKNYYLSALKKALAETDAQLTLAVVNEEPTRPPQSFLEAFEEGVSGTLGFVRRRIATTPSYLQHRPLDEIDLLADVDRVHASPVPVKSRLGHKLPDEAVDQIVERADVVFRHGFGILQGRILTETKYGVLSYHHGDIRRYRGVALGFWNYLHDEPTAGVTLQRLTPELDAGEIVAYQEVDISDCYTWQEARAHLFKESIPLLAEGVNNLIDSDYSPTQPDELGELYMSSDLWEPKTLIHYTLKNNIGRLRRFL